MDESAQEFLEVEGDCQLTNEWWVHLPVAMSQRVEDGALVLWSDSITAWVGIWGLDEPRTIADRLQALDAGIPPGATERVVEEDGELLRASWRVDEGADDGRRPALYGYVLGESGHVQLAIYFSDEAALEQALLFWRNVWEEIS